MATLAKLLVAFGLDATDYQKGLEGVEKETSSRLAGIGSTLEGMGKKAQTWGLGLTAGVTTPLVAMGLKSVDAASDLDESMNKVSVVFGDAADQVVAFSETSALALGQSQQEALEAAGTYGNLFTAMGLGLGVSADMSTGLVTLASDLASFNNAMPVEALDALRAGLVGETEPLKRFGVNLNAAGIASKALELGLADVSVDMTKVQGLTLDLEKAQAKAADAMEKYGEGSLEARDAQQAVAEVQDRLNDALAGTVQQLTPAQKAQAAYALIMEQTTTAQGDFARTSDGLANSTRIAKAQLADAAATMGTGLLPIGLKVIGFVNDLLGRFNNLSPSTQKVILVVAGLAAGLGPLLLGLGTVISVVGSLIGAISAAAPVIGGIVGVIGGPVLVVIAAVAAAIALLWAAWENNWFGIRDTLTAIWEGTLKPALETLVAWFQEVIPKALQWLSDTWNNTLLPALQAVWNFLETYILPILGALVSVAIAVLQKALEVLATVWTNVLKPALEAVWAFLKDYVIPIIGALISVGIAVLQKALHVLASIWNYVIKPALEKVWEFIKGSLIPIFEDIVEKVRGPLGEALQWLKEHILDPLVGAFGAVRDAIEKVIEWINDLAEAINSIHMPDWFNGGGGSLGGGIQSLIGYVETLQEALNELAWPAALAAGPAWATAAGPTYAATARGLEEVRPVAAVSGEVRGGGTQTVQGDTFVIHNHNQLATAMNQAWIEERRRRRLNQTMGA